MPQSFQDDSPSNSAKVFFDGSNRHLYVGASIVPSVEETVVMGVGDQFCTDDLSQVEDQIYQDLARL
jgi:hypothetical protein